MKIGAKVKELRVQKGLTQEELADRTELYYTFFDGSVNGENNILHSFFAGAGRTPF